MEFYWQAYFSTVALVCYEGLCAICEKTFSRKQGRTPHIRLSFLWHWGVVVGDLIILPVFNGIVIPYLNFPIWGWSLFFLASLAITFYCHKAWWPTSEKALGFVYPDWERSGRDKKLWYRDMSLAGGIHFIFMTLQLVIIFGYIFTAMPDEIVWQVCTIFLIFILFGVIEPGVVEGWPLSKEKKLITLGTAIALWLIVGVVTCIKL